MNDEHHTGGEGPGETAPDANPDPSGPGANSPRRGGPGDDWVAASGVHGEHVLGSEGVPRLHRFMMIIGPLGLAVAIVASLWSMSKHVERSVNIQVETQWVPGEQLAVRTQLVGPDLTPLTGAAVTLHLHDAAGAEHELGELEAIGSGLAQGLFEVPELTPGPGELELRYALGPDHRVEPFAEHVPVELLAARTPDDGRQVVSEHMLQWADDTDEQPEGLRIDLRPAGRLLAGFDNRLFIRVTDPAGLPWKPAEGVARSVEVRLVSGEFAERFGKSGEPPLIFAGPLDALGLASFSGLLSSDVVRFEIRLASGAKRTLRFVSHAGTVRIQASTDFAHPGDTVKIAVEAISSRKPVFVDLHDPTGAWVETATPPLHVPQEFEWVVPATLATSFETGPGAAPFTQFEAYQSTLRPEDSSAIARVQIAPLGTPRQAVLPPLIARQRAQLSLPRVDRNFEIGRERAYLSEIERQLGAKSLNSDEVDRARAFLIGSLEAIVHGPPQALNTRAREDTSLAEFKRLWTLAIRALMLGGGGLYIALMSILVWRNQKAFEIRTTEALRLVEGESGLDSEELLADQSLAILGSRRQMLGRGAFTIALMVAALLLSVTMLESLVWEY